MVLVRVRSYSQLFGTRITAAASSIVSHPMAWWVALGTAVAARSRALVGRSRCAFEPVCSGTGADRARASEARGLGISFIPSIKATMRALMEVVIFRTRCGRSARREGIPKGVHKGIGRGSLRGGSRVYPVGIFPSLLLSISSGLPVEGGGPYTSAQRGRRLWAASLVHGGGVRPLVSTSSSFPRNCVLGFQTRPHRPPRTPDTSPYVAIRALSRPHPD